MAGDQKVGQGQDASCKWTADTIAEASGHCDFVCSYPLCSCVCVCVNGHSAHAHCSTSNKAAPSQVLAVCVLSSPALGLGDAAGES